ncbi:hypothetical protein [Spirillospora sp. NBC_01491]|uniref:hypothetical protein n=1 Tax=Spirillospora sp. NBC_01491 TaxID=2976007 RepID=UPI002E3266F5|nr:hypothetical protein [Spirillospora sp. NBC_01491]
MVVDVWCRLSGSFDYLAEASASTDLHLVQISDEPITLHYSAGQQVMDARGLAACLQVTPCDDEDGETCAMKYLRETTAVSWGNDDLWGAKFVLFTLD